MNTNQACATITKRALQQRNEKRKAGTKVTLGQSQPEIIAPPSVSPEARAVAQPQAKAGTP